MILVLERANGGIDQYIGLPHSTRARPMSGREREGSFMGSDFTYRDLFPTSEPGPRYARLPDESTGKDDTYVLEMRPGSAGARGYSKLVTWVRKTDFVPLRTRFFDEDGKVQRTLYVRRIRDLNGKSVVVESLMESVDGHATALIVDREEAKDLPDSEFNPASLDH